MFRLIVLFFLCLSVVPANAETIQKDYHEGLLNSRILFSGNTSLSRGLDSKNNYGFQSFGLTVKTHPNVNIGVSGGYEINRVDDEDGNKFPREYGFGGSAIFHFSPENQIDPYIDFGIGYIKNAISVPSLDGYQGEDGVSFGAGAGIEMKPNRMVSIIPSISYSVVRADGESGGSITPDLTVAFRLSENETWGGLWIAPYVSVGFEAHTSSGLNTLDDTVVSYGLSILSQL